MCACDSYYIKPHTERQDVQRVASRLRTLLDAAGVHEHRLVSDAELYRVWFMARWITLTDNRNPDDYNELARSLRELRQAQAEAGAA